MSFCKMDDSPWCWPGTCEQCDGARAPAPSPVKALAEAVKLIVAEAQNAFVVTTDKAEIKAATDKLTGLLREWTARDRMVTQAIGGLLKLVRTNCKHDGAKRGYNERDGSWMATCPTCGASE